MSKVIKKRRARRKVDHKKLVEFIRDHQDLHDESPTLDEMSRALGQGHSPSVIRYALKSLEKQGRLTFGTWHTSRQVKLLGPWAAKDASESE